MKPRAAFFVLFSLWPMRSVVRGFDIWKDFHPLGDEHGSNELGHDWKGEDGEGSDGSDGEDDHGRSQAPSKTPPAKQVSTVSAPQITSIIGGAPSTATITALSTTTATIQESAENVISEAKASASSNAQSEIDAANASASAVADGTTSEISTQGSRLSLGQIGGIAVAVAVVSALLSAMSTYLIIRHRRHDGEGGKWKPESDSPPQSRSQLFASAPRLNFLPDGPPTYPTYTTTAIAGHNVQPVGNAAYLDAKQGVLPPPGVETQAMIYNAQPLSIPGPDVPHPIYPVSPLSPDDSNGPTGANNNNNNTSTPPGLGPGPGPTPALYASPPPTTLGAISPTQFSLQHFTSGNNNRQGEGAPAEYGVTQTPPPADARHLNATPSSVTATTDRGSGPGHMGWLLRAQAYQAQEYPPPPPPPLPLPPQIPPQVLQVQSPVPKRRLLSGAGALEQGPSGSGFGVFSPREARGL
ncbi:hypothetical protein F4779DRAFT_636398 [Xylariaceae sp. FL0662B]|nr:hypothetical protein F4779DRAFT_636398 [Xylariaceae sp. FL0662B]